MKSHFIINRIHIRIKKDVKFIFLIIVFLTSVHSPVFGQKSTQKQKHYQKTIHKANIAMNKKQYEKASSLYSLAFKTRKLPIDLYLAAQSYAIIDSINKSFHFLFSMADSGCLYNYNTIISDTLFMNLHDDKRWKDLLKKVSKNFYIIRDHKRFPQLSKLIDSLVYYDQKWRVLLDQPNDTMTRKQIGHNINQTDSSNYFALQQIVQKYGCPNYKMVGFKSAHNFWLLIQHQDGHVSFQKEVLTLMKEEVKNNLFSKENYAYLVDRVKVNSDEKQIYGTQMKINQSGTSYIPKDCVKPKDLDIRRKRMGLSSEKEYIKLMNKHYSYSLKLQKNE